MSQAYEDAAAFPLCWPEGWPRTKTKKNGLFKQTVYTATQNLTDQLARMGATQVILSTSIPLRRDGLPLSKPPVDGDHGAAVYFMRKKKPLCLACDQYFDIADNIQALAKTIEAMRGIERWGSTDLLDRAFTGFAALPQSTSSESWWDVLGVSRSATADEITAAYKAKIKLAHPDTGGSNEDFMRIKTAHDAALAQLRKFGEQS